MKVDLLRVRAERIAKGYTQEQMGNLIGLKRGQYNKRETGKVSFSSDELITLAVKLGYSNKDIGIFFKPTVPETQQ